MFAPLPASTKQGEGGIPFDKYFFSEGPESEYCVDVAHRDDIDHSRNVVAGDAINGGDVAEQASTQNPLLHDVPFCFFLIFGCFGWVC